MSQLIDGGSVNGVNKLLWIECFVRSVETGSFSLVAKEMQIGQPNVSRHIASLEKLLGTRLLHRSTRQMLPTADGQRYYAQARHALDILMEADSDMRGQHDPHGLLRVACPESVGSDIILSALPRFLDKYPSVDVDLCLSDEYVDLVAQGIDIASRGGTLKDSAFRARRVGTSERVCVASTAYLQKKGIPRQPEDLVRHECIIYTLLAGGNKTWPFKQGEFNVGGRVRLNNLNGVRQAVLQDLGIAYLPSWMVAAELACGRVRTVLGEYSLGPSQVNALYPAQKTLPKRSSVFLDFLVELFSTVPGLDGVPLSPQELAHSFPVELR